MELDELKHRKRRRKRLIYLAGTLLLVGLLLVLAFWLVHFFGFFHRGEIVVQGNQVLSREEVIEIAYADISRDWWRPFLGISNQFAWPDVVSDSALRLSPRVKSISAEKNIPTRTLTLHIVERQPVGIWCFHQEDPFYCGWWSSDGVLFAPSFRAQGSLLVVVDDYSRPRVGLGEHVLSAQFADRVIQTINEVRAADIDIAEVRLEDLALQELVVKTFGGPDIYFSLRFPPVGLGQALERLGEREDASSLDYIDLRVEGRVYYQ